jgi:hypothetical protein
VEISLGLPLLHHLLACSQNECALHLSRRKWTERKLSEKLGVPLSAMLRGFLWHAKAIVNSRQLALSQSASFKLSNGLSIKESEGFLQLREAVRLLEDSLVR